MLLLLSKPPSRTRCYTPRWEGESRGESTHVHCTASSTATGGSAMIAGLPVVLALLAPAATVYGPAAPVAPKPATAPATAERQCAPTNPDPNSKTIVVCAVRPQGYRLDPDVLE